MVRITKAVLAAIVEHARQDAPVEACGYLGERDGIITACYRMKNCDGSGEHFSLDPEEQFSVLRDMRNNNIQLAAVYHSHPATPARPSEEDIRLAHDPGIRYIIISLMNGEDSIRSFRIRDSRVEHEDIEIMEENVEQSLDLKGVACPMNFVKVKVTLAQIGEGQILEIVLDDGEPMRNVPRSIKEEGHKIIKVEKLTDDSFRLLVRKGG